MCWKLNGNIQLLDTRYVKIIFICLKNNVFIQLYQIFMKYELILSNIYSHLHVSEKYFKYENIIIVNNLFLQFF